MQTDPTTVYPFTVSLLTTGHWNSRRVHSTDLCNRSTLHSLSKWTFSSFQLCRCCL